MAQGDVTTVPVDVGATPLSAQVALLASVFDGLTEGVTVHAPDGRLAYANAAALSTLGFPDLDALRRATPQDHAARRALQDEHGRSLSFADLPARQVLQGAQAAERVVRILAPETGEERWSLVRASPLRDATGKPAAVSLFRDVTRERRAQERQAFLSEASAILARSLDPRAVLSELARLAVPRLADGCSVEIVADDGTLESVALVHADPAKAELGREIRLLYPPTTADAAGVGEVARTGRSFLARDVSRDSLASAARDARHLALLLDTEPRSLLHVPLRTRGRTIGVLSFVLSGPGPRRYDPEDVAFCEELALRAAAALDNGLLHAEAASARERLEEIVGGLRESEERYRFLAEAIPLHVWTATPDGALDYVNGRGADYLGRDPGEVVGNGWRNLVHPDDLPGVLERWTRALETGAPYEAELRLRRDSDATYRWHIARALPLKDERGRVVKWFGTHFDVEDLKAAEGRVRVQKSLLASQMEAVLDGVVLVGNDHRLVTHNRQFARLWALPEDVETSDSDAVLTMLVDRVADPAAFLAGVERLRLSPTEPVRDEVPLRDGRVLERYGAAILDPDGVQHGRVWTFRDITDRKRADETLKRLVREMDAQRARLDTIVRSVPGVVWEAWGAPGEGTQRMGFVSDHVEEMLGYTAEEWLATPDFWLTLVHPEDAERAAAESRAQFEGGHGGTVQFRWRRKDGSYLWAQAWNTILLDEAGRPAGMRGVTMDVTALRNAEDDLRESEERFRRAFSEAGIGMVIKDPDGRLVEANPVFARMLGSTPEEVVGQDFSSLTHPEDTELTRRMMARLVGGEASSVVYEKRYLHKDGRVVWAQVTSSVVRDRDGAPLHVLAQIQDVTARKAAEDALRDQTELVRAITDNAGSALFMMDASGRTVFMNPAATAMTGYASVEEIGDRSLHDAIHFKRPDGAPYPMEACPIDRANAESRPLKGQREVFCRKDGSLFPVAVNLAPIVKDGRPQGAVVEARDVSEEERRERALREHARTLATLNRINTRLAAELDLDRLVQAVVDAATELTGAKAGAFWYEAHDAHGDPRLLRVDAGEPKDAFADPAAPRAAEAFGAAFRAGRVLRIDDATADDAHEPAALLGLSSGRPSARSVLAVPVVSRSGSLFGCLAFAHPEPGAFTEQAERFALGIAAQAAIALDNASLYRSVQARAEELARLAGALERSNRELDQFAYVTSHDLKAPLRGIANLSRWIEEDLGEHVTAEARAHMELLRGRVHRMEALIDAILEYSRVGRRQGKVETVDAKVLLDEVVDLLSPPPGARIQLPDDLPTLRTERARLQQVFLNLVGNALKHHPDRAKAVVTIGVEDAGAHWRFSVADNGRGIPKRFHDKVFAIFQTLEARDKVEGTGIGLAIVKKVVESKGGRVELDSDEGRGATFCFTWPKDEPGGERAWSS